MPVPHLLTVWLTSFAMDLGRYVLVAGGAFAFFWSFRVERFRGRFIWPRGPSTDRMVSDVAWSSSTVLVFSLVGVAVYFGGHSGVLRRYESIADRGVAWFIASIFLLVILQDTYFYWTHRAMHHRRLFRLVHRTHHLSRETSPFTAYALSPIEALVHALFVPLAWMVLPLHDAAVFAFLGFMIVRNVLGHLSIELYPSGFTKSRIWGLHTTTTHHALHHARPRTSFGLYFTFWDRWMKTVDPLYDETFERTVGAKRPEGTGH